MRSHNNWLIKIMIENKNKSRARNERSVEEKDVEDDSKYESSDSAVSDPTQLRYHSDGIHRIDNDKHRTADEIRPFEATKYTHSSFFSKSIGD